jgi:hypothetical protein
MEEKDYDDANDVVVGDDDDDDDANDVLVGEHHALPLG